MPERNTVEQGEGMQMTAVNPKEVFARPTALMDDKETTASTERPATTSESPRPSAGQRTKKKQSRPAPRGEKRSANVRWGSRSGTATPTTADELTKMIWGVSVHEEITEKSTAIEQERVTGKKLHQVRHSESFLTVMIIKIQLIGYTGEIGSHLPRFFSVGANRDIYWC